MVSERSDKVYEHYRQATEKFDYFVLGTTGALCAYISQVYKPAKLGLNPATLELLSLIILVGSAIAGFRRVEKTLKIISLNHALLRANEMRGVLVSKANQGTLINESTGDIMSPQVVAERINSVTKAIPTLERQIEQAGSSAVRSYSLRNGLLFIGFAALLVAKVWSAYI